MNMSFDQMVSEIEDLIKAFVSETPFIRGITIASLGGKNIYSTFQETFELSQNELAASTTSLLFLATNLFEHLLNQQVNYTVTKGEKWILLCILTKAITGSIILDRKLVELAGFNEYKNKILELLLKISAIVETSEVIKEDLFVKIKRAIPNALSIGIINKEGMPIKVQSAMEGPKLSAFIYAMHQLTNVILRKKAEYTIIGGEFCSFIIHQIDDERILGIAVPENDEQKIGKYIAKLQEIVNEKKP